MSPSTSPRKPRYVTLRPLASSISEPMAGFSRMLLLYCYNDAPSQKEKLYDNNLCLETVLMATRSRQTTQRAQPVEIY